MPDSLFLSLVVPTYNEADNIRDVLKTLVAVLDPVCPEGYEILVVDDDSPDRTWAIAEEVARVLPMVRVCRRQGERGLATAVIHGWQQAHGTVVGVIDGDLQHPPEVLGALLARMREGADLAVASRNIEGGGVSDWSLFRRFASRGAQLLGLLLLPEVLGRVTDPMSGFFLIRRDLLPLAEMRPQGYKILIESIGRGRPARIAEVPYVFRERTQGASKVSRREYLAYLSHLGRLRLALWRRNYFLRFGVVGGSGVLVDTLLLFLFHGQWGIPLFWAKLMSAELTVFWNFALNDRWTFRRLAMTPRQRRQWPKRLLKFNLICAAGIGLSVLLLLLFARVIGINYLLANLLAIALVFCWNFWLNRKLNWVDGNS